MKKGQVPGLTPHCSGKEISQKQRYRINKETNTRTETDRRFAVDIYHQLYSLHLVLKALSEFKNIGREWLLLSRYEQLSPLY